MVAISRLGHVGIAVRDLDAAVDFYCGVLGLKLSERFVYPDDGPGHAVREAAFIRCGTDHHTLSVFALKEEPASPGGPGGYGLHHIAFELPTYERLVEAHRALRDAGAFIQSQRAGGPGNQPRFYARDPDGNLLEFIVYDAS